MTIDKSDILEYEEDEMVEMQIDLMKKYSLPSEIKIVKHRGIYLGIYTEGIMWIVLREEEEVEVFNSIREGKSIEYLYKNYTEKSVTNVIMQIEAKKFEKPRYSENSEKNVYIYLTNNCNQSCRHCYMYAGDIDIEEVSANRWLSILDGLKNAGCQGVTFTGGEITVYENFDIVLKHAHDIGLSVTVLSNGILWDEKMVEKLYFYIDEIQISIDGYDRDSYYSVRQYDGFEKAINCVKLFCDKSTKVSVAVTPLYDNLDVFVEKFELFASRFLEHNPDVFIKINHELITGREIDATEEKNREYRIKLKTLVEKLYPNYYIETFVLNYENKAIRSNCGFGGISIGANGDVYWCNRIHELNSSINVFDSSIEDIFALGEKIKSSTSVNNTSECKECDIKYICGGGCRMKYEGIKKIETHKGEWKSKCEGKDNLYEKMILSNEYFFEE